MLSKKWVKVGSKPGVRWRDQLLAHCDLDDEFK